MSLYDKGREGFLDGSIVWTSDNIKAVLVDTGSYTVNLSTHQYLSDIPSGARIATSANLSSKTATAGVADAADITFSSVGGASAEAVVLYKDTGTAGTSRLIWYTTSGSGLPVTPNTGDITIAWGNTSNKIFKL
ncbi:hypothetical protein QM806_04325 [Rhodococcus sp. IEGM 1351]|uniref:hypothetical protein n=1 Tax=Rhodococcus sp. IEGM 1351 TaxID=3047089 RepID=UPI0024B665C0|nr:hypothetical protein [Rhodococcus sp. IEGM 1351]MDI9934680.1 hypothetical protein [Rhodococcus sp. IEGM 1351]